MKIVCPDCGTAYNLPDSAIPAQGRVVRCKKCGAGWRALPEGGLSTVEEAAIEPEAAVYRARQAGAKGGIGSGIGSTSVQAVSIVPTPLFDPPDEDESLAPEIEHAVMPDDSAITPFTDALKWQSDHIAEFGDDTAGNPPTETTTDVAGTPRSLPDRPNEAGRAGTYSRKRAKKRRYQPHQLASPLFSYSLAAIASVVTIVLLASLFVLRMPIVVRIPGLASLYASLGLPVNIRGLEFANVRTYRETDHNASVLVIEGEIENNSNDRHGVPLLRFGLRSDQRREVYAWTMNTQTATLDPGEHVRFKTRLPAPPQAASEVLVQFTDYAIRQ